MNILTEWIVCTHGHYGSSYATPDDVSWLMIKKKSQHCVKRSYCNRRPRDPLGEVLRLEVRVAISVETLIRRKLGEPIDPKLSEPSPLTEEYCIKPLQKVAACNPETKRPLHKTDKELGGGLTVVLKPTTA